jgi:hypothetical protein
MTGFVIYEVKNNGGGYLLRQLAAQTYLKKYGGNNWEKNNKSYYKDSKYGKKIKEAIKSAWQDYKAYKSKKTDTNNSDTFSDPSITVLSGDTGLYYNSFKNAYYSYKITVNVSIHSENANEYELTLSTNDDAVRICKTSDCSFDSDAFDSDAANTSMIVKGVKANNIYLVTTKANATPKLTVTVTRTVDSGSKTTYYDTKMYKSKYSGYQKLVILEKKTNTSPSVTSSKSSSQAFTVHPVKTSDCSKLYNGWSTSNEIDKTDSSGIICENNNSSSVETDSSKYTASFKTCKNKVKKTIDFFYKSSNVCTNSSASTWIVVGQQGVFTFGGVLGDRSPIIKGQGFYLTKNNTFKVGLSWKKSVIYSTNDDAYFYLSNSGDVTHSTTVYNSEDDCKSGKGGQSFDDYAKSVMKSGISIGKDTDISKIYETYVNDSNKLEKVLVDVEKTGNVDTVIKEGTVNTITYKFSTPSAYIKISNGMISYEDKSEDNKYKAAGKRYYTMLKYPGERYKFNVNVANLSLIEGVNWKLTGTCDIDLCTDKDCPQLYKCEGDKCSVNYTYRSISVTNPFPKRVPSNWSGYDTNGIKQRLANTFNNKIYYSINFNYSGMSKILDYNSSNYVEFNNINSEGKSSVVSNSNGFDISNANGSYCPIGQYNSNCDK